ncbi:MAG: CDF family Co(II)/Ni(II) efflux transporter DmeF [Burkholderiales bacterium]
MTAHNLHPHAHDLAGVRQRQAFGAAGAAQRSRALAWVALLTLVTMAIELVAGYLSGSLALSADGWHMGSHAAALGGAWLAAHLARRAHDHADYAFGGWKIEVLAGYTSALVLAGVALGLVVDSVQRLVQPQPVAYVEALVVAVFGLLVNLASAWLLARGERAGRAPASGDPDHGHNHDAEHGHPAHHHGHAHAHAHGHDHNFQAAYVHVLADALTSLLAIAALAAGMWWQLHWADPVVALVGAAVIARWSLGLIKGSARALVDATAEPSLRDAVRAAVESDADAKLADLHVWQVGPSAFAAALAIVADRPLPAQAYRERLAPLKALRHVTIEVHRCPQAEHGAGGLQPR